MKDIGIDCGWRRHNTGMFQREKGISEQGRSGQ